MLPCLVSKKLSQQMSPKIGAILWSKPLFVKGFCAHSFLQYSLHQESHCLLPGRCEQWQSEG
jgi:hypothetical protein